MSIENRVIMFMDIHNFSMVMTSLEEKQFEFLQEVYERLGDIIVTYQGEIIKYMGDAILCIFPANSEERAIQCAVELRRAFAQIITENSIPHEAELEVGIGSDAVAIGMFGHRSLRMKDIFGEEINRVAMIGHHRGIGITENMYEQIGLSHKTRELPKVKVKWQREPLKFWEVIV